MKLPDNEIRDITQILEQGKSLPDKYRFMLFDDDREIELVWNGKSQDATNVVLPFQTIEHIDKPRPDAEVQRQPDLFDVDSPAIQARRHATTGGQDVEIAPDSLMTLASIAETYWALSQQSRNTRTFELDTRPFVEPF
jgi:hypothetical protein